MVAWSARQGDWMFNVYIIIFLYFVCNKVTGLGLHLKFGPMGVSGNKKKTKFGVSDTCLYKSMFPKCSTPIPPLI